MKKITAKLTVKVTEPEDPCRDFKVSKDDVGWITITAGRNLSYPEFKIHPDDVEKLIATIYAVVKSKLPTDL